jgi:hypothetical protein
VAGLHCLAHNVVHSVVSGCLFSEAGIRAYSHLWGPDYVNVFIYDLYLHVAFLLFAVLGRRGILIGLPFFKNEDFGGKDTTVRRAPFFMISFTKKSF